MLRRLLDYRALIAVAGVLVATVLSPGCASPPPVRAPAVMQVHEKSNLYHARWSPDGKWLRFTTDITSRGATAAELAIGPLEDAFAVAEFGELRRWLAHNIHRHGMRYRA